MQVFNVLYTIFIGPLKILFEFIFTISYFVTNNLGFSIIILSLTMNMLLLPLYKKADQIQEEENKKQESMKDFVDHIKKSFKGDEQYMILSTYYKQNDYKPIYSIRGLISLILEIPFFIAAYDFLSNLNIIKNVPFGPIQNLSLPDQMLGGWNLLPILMTIINVVSCFIYTKGKKFSKNIQLYIIAVVFLILLYNAPSGLVLYYLFNNIFSLIKNILTKFNKAKYFLFSTCSFVSIFAMVYLFINPLSSTVKQIFAIIIILALNIPLLLNVCKLNLPPFSILENKNVNNKLFFTCSVFICLLIGLYIPSQLISSSVAEFVDKNTLINPNEYIFNTLYLSIGAFIIWFNIYYILVNDKFKKVLDYLIFCISIIAVINYLFFGRNLGLISNTLVYEDNIISFTLQEKVLNIFISLLVIVVSYIVLIKKRQYIKKLLLVTIAAFISVSSINVVKNNNEYKEAIVAIEKIKENKPSFTLSKNGKNVIIITLDRFVSSFLPYMLEEIPELKSKLDGFTFYPNTVSLGGYTKTTTPSLYGGYEYAPKNMKNYSRSELIFKHNESMKVLPVLFDKNGYDVSVFDLPYGNYEENTDLSIFNEYENIDAKVVTGYFSLDGIQPKRKVEDLKELLFSYSIMKCSPLILQSMLYNSSAYNKIDLYKDIFGTSISQNLIDSYAVLKNLNIMTSISNDTIGGFVIMHNYTSHSLAFLDENTYDLEKNEDFVQYHKERYLRNGQTLLLDDYLYKSYSTCIASLIQVTNYFDYLRANDLYDNTRIILVSDHGLQYNVNLNNYCFGENNESLLSYNPLLLVKDFNKHGYETNDTFMSNADVPYLAIFDIFEKVENPFSGKEINNIQKINEKLEVCLVDENNIETKGNPFMTDNYYYVHDNIFDSKNWESVNSKQ